MEIPDIVFEKCSDCGFIYIPRRLRGHDHLR